MDKCVTAFGRRLLRNWLTRPLAQISAINERLNAVEDLMNNEEVTQSSIGCLFCCLAVSIQLPSLLSYCFFVYSLWHITLTAPQSPPFPPLRFPAAHQAAESAKAVARSGAAFVAHLRQRSRKGCVRIRRLAVAVLFPSCVDLN